ncbi:MAG: hypothetical protein J6K32_05120 [Clostridia bacterium]|nr:hypothetical protein [Clostridia bacterium]
MMNGSFACNDAGSIFSYMRIARNAFLAQTKDDFLESLSGSQKENVRRISVRRTFADISPCQTAG